MKNFLWKVYFLLLVLSLIGGAGLVPYAMALSGGTPPAGIPESLFGLASFLQSFLLTSVMAFFGLKLSLSGGLGVPVLENIFYGVGGKRFKVGYHLAFPAIVGVVCGVVIVVLDLLMADLFQFEIAADIQVPVWWKGFLASFYGGMSEEMMMRLFAMNLVIVILNAAGRNSGKNTSAGKVVAAMIISSLIFGIGHISAALAVGTATPAFIARTVILNFIPGMAFGWLYWRRSFLSAMAAHFSADIVVHVAARFVLDNLTC